MVAHQVGVWCELQAIPISILGIMVYLHPNRALCSAVCTRCVVRCIRSRDFLSSRLALTREALSLPGLLQSSSTRTCNHDRISCISGLGWSSSCSCASLSERRGESPPLAANSGTYVTAVKNAWLVCCLTASVNSPTTSTRSESPTFARGS